MRPKLLSLFVGMIVAIPLSPAASQDPDFQVQELSRNDVQYLRTVRPFADCLVAHQATEIPKFLGSGLNTEWIAREMAKAHPECLRPKSGNQPTSFFLQGAILESLIRRDFGNVPAPAGFQQVPPFVYVKDTSNSLIREEFASFMEPYDCTTRRDPAGVQAFLRTEPMSLEEASAFKNLQPAFAACHPKGETWEIRPYYARRYLAETFYTLMKVDQRRKAGIQ